MSVLRICLVLWAILLLMPVMAVGQDPDPLLPDTIRVDSVATTPGVPVAVQVTFWNDEEVTGYSLGFHWSSPDVTFDSVRYWDSRLSWYVNRYLTVDNVNQMVLVGMADLTYENPLAPGDGNVFTMWFGVPSSTPDQYVIIDSAFFPPAGTFTIAPTEGGSVVPQYKVGKIKVGNPPPPPVIVLSDDLFEFDAELGGGNPTSQVLNITNAGGPSLQWTADWDEPWLGVNPSSGTAPSVVVITANITGLTPGSYEDTVTVSAAGATNSPQTFRVTLDLTVPPPTISVIPDSFYFQALQDSASPPTQVMNIDNVGMGTLNWTATESAPWLDLSAYSGTGSAAVTLTVDNTGMTHDLYTTEIEITAPYATNSPQTVPVLFEVFSAFPVIDPYPDSIFATGSPDFEAYDRILQVRNNGGGIMNWSITHTQPWLSIDIDTGSTLQGSPSLVTVSFDGSLVGSGGHHDTLVINSGNAINSPFLVPVTYWKTSTPPVLNVSFHSLQFTTVECGTFPAVAPKTFYVSGNLPSPPLNWTLTHHASWMTVTPTGAPGNQTVTVTVSEDGLAPGIYMDTITVSSEVAINPPQVIPVTFTINPSPTNPDLMIDRDSLFYAFKWTLVGAENEELHIYAQGGGCLDWQATASVPWLTIIPNSGTTMDTVTIRGDAVGLALGRHIGEVIFTSADAPNSPVHIPTVLWVYTLGDANGDGIVNITDVVYIINYIFGGGPSPVPFAFVGDVDCNHITNIADVVWLIDWIFGAGPPPCAY